MDSRTKERTTLYQSSADERVSFAGGLASDREAIRNPQVTIVHPRSQKSLGSTEGKKKNSCGDVEPAYRPEYSMSTEDGSVSSESSLLIICDIPWPVKISIAASKHAER